MRIGINPNKEVNQEQSAFIHQIIIPVYIPNEEGYFVDSFKILKLCLNSLLDTVHDRTYITIVNNGSCQSVVKYLDTLFLENKIRELIHTDNIGKINAVLKGLSGNNIELVTITDADVLFLPDWQFETTKVFIEIPKAGVVGIVPQLRMYKTNCGNVIFDNLFNKHLKFIAIKNPEALIHFYESIGWGRAYNSDYLKLGLGLEYDTIKCFVGAGHFVATYKKDVFEELFTFIGGKKVAGIGEAYIDNKAKEKDYWRLTTYDNYAYHMGNVYEDWMEESSENTCVMNYSNFNFAKRRKQGAFSYFVKKQTFCKVYFHKMDSKIVFEMEKITKRND